MNLTNAQAALMAAAQQEGLSSYSVKERADQYLKWLEDNS